MASLSTSHKILGIGTILFCVSLYSSSRTPNQKTSLLGVLGLLLIMYSLYVDLLGEIRPKGPTYVDYLKQGRGRVTRGKHPTSKSKRYVHY